MEFGLVTGSVGLLYLVTAGIYKHFADLHTLQISTAHAHFIVFISRCPVTDHNNVLFFRRCRMAAISQLTHGRKKVMMAIDSSSQVRVKSVLRPTVVRPVWLGVKPPTGDQDHNFCCHTAAFLFMGVPSLTRGRVCHLRLLLAFASAVFLGSELLASSKLVQIHLVLKCLLFFFCLILYAYLNLHFTFKLIIVFYN
jgi:hypothetical protein